MLGQIKINLLLTVLGIKQISCEIINQIDYITLPGVLNHKLLLPEFASNSSTCLDTYSAHFVAQTIKNTCYKIQNGHSTHQTSNFSLQKSPTQTNCQQVDFLKFGSPQEYECFQRFLLHDSKILEQFKKFPLNNRANVCSKIYYRDPTLVKILQALSTFDGGYFQIFRVKFRHLWSRKISGAQDLESIQQAKQVCLDLNQNGQKEGNFRPWILRDPQSELTLYRGEYLRIMDPSLFGKFGAFIGVYNETEPDFISMKILVVENQNLKLVEPDDFKSLSKVKITSILCTLDCLGYLYNPPNRLIHQFFNLTQPKHGFMDSKIMCKTHHPSYDLCIMQNDQDKKLWLEMNIRDKGFFVNAYGLDYGSPTHDTTPTRQPFYWITDGTQVEPTLVNKREKTVMLLDARVKTNDNNSNYIGFISNSLGKESNLCCDYRVPVLKPSKEDLLSKLSDDWHEIPGITNYESRKLPKLGPPKALYE